MRKTNLILIGFQASGKTTVGQLLANYLQTPFYDSDELIQASHPGLTCAMIFKQFGETYFRELESQVIQTLSTKQRSVIAVGGGVVMQPKNQLSLKQHGLCIYLKTNPDTLRERIWSRPNLPAYLDSNDPYKSFIDLFQRRSSLYEAMADHILDMEQMSFAKVTIYLGKLFDRQEMAYGI